MCGVFVCLGVAVKRSSLIQLFMFLEVFLRLIPVEKLMSILKALESTG